MSQQPRRAVVSRGAIVRVDREVPHGPEQALIPRVSLDPTQLERLKSIETNRPLRRVGRHRPLDRMARNVPAGDRQAASDPTPSPNTDLDVPAESLSEEDQVLLDSARDLAEAVGFAGAVRLITELRPQPGRQPTAILGDITPTLAEQAETADRADRRRGRSWDDATPPERKKSEA